MAESDRQKQSRFVKMLARLIDFAYENGYELTLGDGYRDPRVFGIHGETKPGAYGKPYSNHKIRMAQDFNLFRDGEWLQETADFRPLGEFWETLAPDARWGGWFNDGNHFSLEHNGRK